MLNLRDHDQQQRELALNPTQSFIVQAPAGSGKTELLIQRYLLLLGLVNKPEEILAITFTKKAANEMRSRIIKALHSAKTQAQPTTAHARKTWQLAKNVLHRDQQLDWQLIANPNQLRIQTIDSLCAYLTKQLPLLANFGSQPKIAENAEFLYSEAIQELLSHVEEKVSWSSAISKILLHLDNNLNKLHDLLVALLSKRDQWIPYVYFAENETAVRNRLEYYLQTLIAEHLQATLQLFPNSLIRELIALIHYACNNLKLKYPHAALPACNAQCLAWWQWITNLLLTKTGTWRQTVDKRNGFPAPSSFKNVVEKAEHVHYRKRYKELIKQLTDCENLRLALVEIGFLPQGSYDDEQWEILQSLLTLLKIATAQLRLTFQQHGQIDFIENTQAALTALGTDEQPTDLALALDYQIKHILIDEFQDTSLTQYQLVKKLVAGWENNDGRTLFVVGDPMQSIYRFREAEVGLFIRMQNQGIANLKLIPLTLSINFRSHNSIINWNNQQFQALFPKQSDIATGAVTFSASICAYEKDQQHYVYGHGFNDENETSQCQHISKIIKQHQQQNKQETIAILVRSRSALTNLLPALKQANIAYSAVDIDPLLNRQCIQDLLALTCALLHPGDRIAWLSILRAPWCGLPLNDLHVIAGDDPHTLIWDKLIQIDYALLTLIGQLILKRAIPVLEEQFKNRQRYPLRDWIENTWYALGGPATLHTHSDMEDVQVFFELLNELQQQAHAINLHRLREKIANLFATTDQNQQTNLQIMTIHSAKGLEFDTVILPFLERKPINDDHSLLLWLEQPYLYENRLLLAPIHATGAEPSTLYRYIQQQRKRKLDYEADRVLYVATTRAKKNLYLLFNAEQDPQGKIQCASGSFLSKLQLELANKPNISSDNIIYLREPNKKEKVLSRLASHWQNPFTLPAILTAFSHNQSEGFLLADETPRLLGIIIHKILQQLAIYSVQWWKAHSKEDKQHYLRQHMQLAGIAPNKVAILIERVQKIIDSTLQDKRGNWILMAHKEHRGEFALTTVVNEQPMQLIIDRTFIDEKGIRWVIDYKTTAYSHADLEQFLAYEQEKYLEKMHLYAQAFQQQENRPIHLGLYFPALSAWKEWVYT